MPHNDTTGASDYITTDAGDYTITMGAGNSTVHTTGMGNQTITTGAGISDIITGAGNSTITTGDGGSTIHTGNGNNTITTGAGGSKITTGNGNDTITTGADKSVVDSGTGNDTVTTGAGDDEVIYHVTGNLGNHSTFTGGTGINTLILKMTNPELDITEMKSDVVNYFHFLADNKGAAAFTFKAFGLTASMFEKLQVLTVDDQQIEHQIDLVALVEHDLVEYVGVHSQS